MSFARTHHDGLQIRLLGELEVTASGRALALPPSKKTRALLGYLVLSGRTHRRDRLCELFWDVTDDPRAALRWSLSKLRELCDTPGRTRLQATREHVSLDLSDVYVDALELKRLLASPLEDTPTAALESARGHFRGELLEGLELPDFHAYYAWCVAERKEWRDFRRRLISVLLTRVGAQPDKALPLVRELVELDPLDEGARAKLLELLHARGRIREAEEQSRVERRLVAEVPRAEEPAESFERPRRSAPFDDSRFVGREAERARIGAMIACAKPRVTLIAGDAGIGKSRLLRELARAAASEGCRVLTAAVPEVRSGFPYAPWLDLLRAADPSYAERLALAPTERDAHEHADGTARLFQTALTALEAAAQGGRLLLALEDVHWLDDASAKLLHFLARTARAPLALILTARAGELRDRPAVAQVVRSLRREALLEEVALAPLSRDETLALIAPFAHPEQREQVFEQSAGNPLFALELARNAEHLGEQPPRTITRAVRDRLDALSPEQVDVLRWASVLGRQFDSSLLGQLVAQAPEALVETLEQLERYGFFEWPSSGAGEALCAFSHDVVRRSVYDQLSEPRRRLMHARVGKLLGARNEVDTPLAALLAHHAALGGDRALAARACLEAGARSLRFFADADALELALRGLRYAEEIPDPERTTLSLELVQLRLRTRRPAAIDELMPRLVQLTTRALELGCNEHARLGFYLRAILMWEHGRFADARHFTSESERICRRGDPRERLLGLAEAARCLAQLERDLPEAEAFLLEAECLAAQLTERVLPLPLARGLLCLHRGERERASEKLEEARALAQGMSDWREEYNVLEALFDLTLQGGAHEQARSISEAMLQLTGRLRHGTDAAYAEGLCLLAALAGGTPLDRAAFSRVIDELRELDAKQRSAFLQARAAELELLREDYAHAAELASRALALADAVERASEAALALAVLVEAQRALEGAASPPLMERLKRKPELPIAAYAHAAVARALASAQPRKSAKGKNDGARDRRTTVR